MKKIGYVICLTITFLTFMFLFPITSKAAGFDSESPKVVQYYLDEDGNQVRNPKTDLPTYIVFKPGTEHYKAYGNTKLWEHQHMGCYLWYTLTEPIPHKQTTKESIDYSRIIENRAERSSLDYEWLVERKKGIYQNLKLGSKIPNKHGYDSFVGENTGTTLIVNPSKYEGKYYEWRYLGYAENGVVIENPFFPPDYPNDNFNPLKRDWWLEPWKKAHGHPKKIDASYYDRDEMFQQKVEWFVKYLFPELPEFRRAKQFPNIYDDAADWARKFSLRTNPDKSTGVIVGFHGSGYYATFTLKPPKLPNMRVIEMKVWDKETGELIGHMINPPPENPCNPKKFMRDKRPINNSEVAVGDTLIIQATVQYFNDGDKSPTEHKPLKMLQMVAIDEDAVPLYANEWTIKPVENVLSSSGIEHLNPGDKITFDMMEDPATGEIKQWEFTVTPDIQKEFVFAAEIPDMHYYKGDNHFTGDDQGRLRFFIEKQDIATNDDLAELIDENCNVVTDVTPHKTYGLRVYLTRPKGKNPVGDPNNPKANPFAMVEVEVTDGVNTRVLEGTAKDVLVKGGKVAIDIPNAITPETSIITAKWKVHWKHQATRQNEIFDNDTGTTYRKEGSGKQDFARNGFE